MSISPSIATQSGALDDDSPAVRLQRSRRSRALDGYRRVDVMLSPAASAALQEIIQRRRCTAKDAIEMALILQTKGLKKQ